MLAGCPAFIWNRAANIWTVSTLTGSAFVCVCLLAHTRVRACKYDGVPALAPELLANGQRAALLRLIKGVALLNGAADGDLIKESQQLQTHNYQTNNAKVSKVNA